MIGVSTLPEPWLCACFIVAGCLPGLLLGYWVVSCHRRRTAIELASIRQEVEASSLECRKAVERVAYGVDQLESGMCSSEEMLNSGRLSRSTRTQALQLLRAGILPDNAATSVGLAKREMRLLAHISRILANP